MFHYQENITDSNGTALNGWSIGLYAVGGDPATAPAITIYADRAGTTPIPGGTVRAVELGYVSFYVPSGAYSRRYYDAGGNLTNRNYPDTDFYDSQDALTYANMASAAATAAASSASGAASSAATATTQAGNAAASADAAATNATIAAASATTATTQAGAVAAAMNSSNAPFPNAYASALPQGVLSTTITAAGTGGTSGTYALGVSGGPTGFAGTYTISGGGVTAITITNPGLSTSNTAPTLSFPSGGVTGATATATVGSIVLSQRTYWVASADSSQILLYGNNAGAVATAPFGGTQLALYSKGGVDSAVAVTKGSVTQWVRQGPAAAPLTTGSIYNPTTGASSANALYQAVTLTLTGSELGLRATGRTSGTSMALACYYDAGNAFISSEFTGGASPLVYTNQVLNPPANARKVIICSLISGASVGVDVLTVRDFSTTATQAGLGNAAAASLASWTDSGSSVVTGSYINNVVAVVVTGGFQYLDYTITANDIAFKATGTENGTATQLACYVDGNGQSLGTQFTGTGSVVAYTGQALTIPVGTVKIRLSGTTGGTLSLSVQKVSATAAADIVSAAAGGVRGNAAAATLDIFQASGGSSVTGFYISTAGVPVSNAGYQYLDYTLDGSESAYQASGAIIGGATQFAIYLSTTGAVLGSFGAGTGSVVTYTNQALTPPTGTVKIRITSQAAVAITLSVKKPIANAAALIQAGGSNTALSVWGDSMGFMLSPVLAALYPSRTTYNQSIGGQTTQQTAARMGAIQVTATGGFTMPATVTTVAVTPSIDLLFSNRSSAWSCRVMVLGIECWLVCAATTGAYTLQPVTAPGSAFTIPAGTPIKPISGVLVGTDPSSAPLLKTMLSGTVVIRCSRNDTALISGGAGRTTVIGYMQAMVNQVAAAKGNCLLMTGTNGTFDMPISSGLPGASSADAATADSKLSAIATFNALLLSTFPDVAVDPLGNHVMRGGSTNQTPVSTTYAVLDSSTLQSDGLHENSTGQARTAAQVQANITSRGF